ncbi:hypothetical protein HK101_006007 [Irineochytrium annulatum]|nr:hypothetical protein HK101_006007 [Irineochytrium annulatum]
MSRYNSPAALDEAVTAARSLPIDRSGDVWRIDVGESSRSRGIHLPFACSNSILPLSLASSLAVCKNQFILASISNTTGLIRASLTLPSTNPVTGALLLDLLLQSSLMSLSSQPQLRPRSIALQCTRNPDGLVSGDLFLVPLSCVAELEELMRGCGISVRIRVSMRAEEAAEERERNRRRMWEERTWASVATGNNATAMDMPGSVVYARGAPTYRGGSHGWPVNGDDRNAFPAKRGKGRTVTAEEAEWWDGGGGNGNAGKGGDMEDVSCFRIIVKLLMLVPVVNLIIAKLRLVEGSRPHRGVAGSANAKVVR